MELSDVSRLCLSNTEMECWITSHELMVNVNHFFVPDSCYSEIELFNESGTPVKQSDRKGHTTRPHIVESSDRLSSPIFKQPKRHRAVQIDCSKFVDYEAAVSGPDNSDDESYEDCSSMLEFIDDRSQITIHHSSLDEGSSTLTSGHSSMMAFYRQSLLSSQVSEFSQPARKYDRSLKISKNCTSKDTEYSNESTQAESAFQNIPLDSLECIDWSENMSI
jgi:hypothetical protein